MFNTLEEAIKAAKQNSLNGSDQTYVCRLDIWDDNTQEIVGKEVKLLNGQEVDDAETVYYNLDKIFGFAIDGIWESR